MLAEAAKQSELKTGHPLKGVEIPPTPPNGSANGHHKKDEEAPAITEPPEIVVNYFNSKQIWPATFTCSRYFLAMRARFAEAQQSSVVDALHVATLTQEVILMFKPGSYSVSDFLLQAFIFLVIETLRFKSASVIKIYKLNPVSSFRWSCVAG